MPGKVTTRSESRAQRALDSAPYENTRSRRQASLGNFTVSYRSTDRPCPPLAAFLETCRPLYSAPFAFTNFNTSTSIHTSCKQVRCNPIDGVAEPVNCDTTIFSIREQIGPREYIEKAKVYQGTPKLPILGDEHCREFLTTDRLGDRSYTRFQEICAMATFKPFTPTLTTIPAEIEPINGTMNGTMSAQDLLQGAGIIFGSVAAASITGIALGAAIGGVWRYLHPPKDQVAPTPTPRLQEQETTLTAQPTKKGK